MVESQRCELFSSLASTAKKQTTKQEIAKKNWRVSLR